MRRSALLTRSFSIFLRTSLFILSAAVFFNGCESSPTMAEDQSDPYYNFPNGIPTEEITWISWEPEIIYEIKNIGADYGDIQLKRSGFASDLVDEAGGSVGGYDTYDNSIYFSPGSLSEDTWVSVELSCQEITPFYNLEQSAEMLGVVDQTEEDLDTLVGELTGEDAEDAALAAAALDEARIYFMVYAFMTDNNVFNIMKNEVAGKMRDFAQKIKNDDLDQTHHNEVQGIAAGSAQSARMLAQTAIDYAQLAPGAQQNKISQAVSRMENGDEYLSTLDNGLTHDGLEWYKYKQAINKYKDAWKKARQALPDSNVPGALVEFDPGTLPDTGVTITLSYSNLTVPADDDSDEELPLELYFTIDEGDNWLPLEDKIVDPETETVIIDEPSSTRYAWGLKGSTGDDSQEN